MEVRVARLAWELGGGWGGGGRVARFTCRSALTRVAVEPGGIGAETCDDART